MRGVIGVKDENLHYILRWIHKSSRIACSADSLQPVAGFCVKRGATLCILYRVRDQSVAMLSSKIYENRSIARWTLKERQDELCDCLRHIRQQIPFASNNCHNL